MQSTSILRLFISLNPSPEIVSRLRDQQTFLRERLDERYGLELSVRWTKPAQFHLTLLFLGNLFWQQLEWIQRQIAETVAAAKDAQFKKSEVAEWDGGFPIWGSVIHTLPCDKEFDSASSRFASICSRP